MEYGFVPSLDQPNLNSETRSLSTCACADNSSLAAALSSEVAVLFCTTLEICSIPCFAWEIENTCCLAASAMPSTVEAAACVF